MGQSSYLRRIRTWKKKMKKARTSARADISVRKDEEEEKDLQQKLIGRYINAVSLPMLSKG